MSLMREFVGSDLEWKIKNTFDHENSRAHKGVLAKRDLGNLKYNKLEHPSNLPDLPSSNFHLFPTLTKIVAKSLIGSVEMMAVVPNGYFADLPGTHFKEFPSIY